LSNHHRLCKCSFKAKSFCPHGDFSLKASQRANFPNPHCLCKHACRAKSFLSWWRCFFKGASQSKIAKPKVPVLTCL
jgi:hypothetical protein